MAWKGSKDCCCDGCHSPPRNFQLGVRDVQPQQQYCCACVPNQICVTVYCESTPGISATVLLDKRCTNDVDGPILYQGIVPFANEQIDLLFRFTVENEQCYFCLESAVLGLNGLAPYDCHLIDAEQRARPSIFCQQLWIDGLPATWTITGAYADPFCPGDNLIVSVTKANNTPIIRSAYCKDEYGNTVEDDHPIRNLCGGCGCICTCACITVTTIGGSTLYLSCLPTEEECRDPTYAELYANDCISWAGGGYTISLSQAYDGCCELDLTEFNGNSPSPLPEPVQIGPAANPCPNPAASWSFFDDNNDPVTVRFDCASCSDCLVTITECCNGQLPRVLTATISGTSGLCTCFNGAISLVYDPVAEWWLGSATFCEKEVELTFFCSGYGWGLNFTSGACVVVPGTLNTVTSDCDPLNAAFSFQLSGIGCCGVGDLGGPHNITITITE